jgi:predicted nucleotidyltransferase component of viral defense system
MTLNINHHEAILINALKAIFSDPAVAPYLAFKGGTAAMLFYGLDRFSVDLDFDLLDESKEKVVSQEIQKILEKYGKLKESENKRYNLLFFLAYEGKEDNAQNLKVEINKRNFGSSYDIKEFMGIPVKVMIKADMTAHKLVAMYERIGKTNRDIYDVWYFLQNNWPVNKDIVVQRTNKNYEEFLKACIDELTQIKGNPDILRGLGELLTPKQKVWVKAKLVDETVFKLRLALRMEQRQQELEDLASR